MIPVEKDKKYKVKVINLVGNKEGLCHVENFPIYIQNVNENDIGETKKIKINNIKKHYATAIKI